MYIKIISMKLVQKNETYEKTSKIKIIIYKKFDVLFFRIYNLCHI